MSKSLERCRLYISKEDLNQALKLKIDLVHLAGKTRRSHTKRIILLHICKNMRRQKLKASEACLADLVREYGNALPPCPYVMRWIARVREPIFRPFQQKSNKDIRILLVTGISLNGDREGFVYALNWAPEPSFFKIGCAKTSAENTVKDWERCDPEAEVIFNEPFQFPERMEDLIHLHLIDKRYQMDRPCERCAIKHAEWSKVPMEDVKRVVEEWGCHGRKTTIFNGRNFGALQA